MQGGTPAAPAKAKQVRGERCPKSDASDETMAAWVERWKLDRAHAEFTAFVDYHRTRGTVFVDWGAAWRNWLRNAVKFAARRPGAIVQSAENRAWKMPEGFE